MLPQNPQHHWGYQMLPCHLQITLCKEPILLVIWSSYNKPASPNIDQPVQIYTSQSNNRLGYIRWYSLFSSWFYKQRYLRLGEARVFVQRRTMISRAYGRTRISRAHRGIRISRAHRRTRLSRAHKRNKLILRQETLFTGLLQKQLMYKIIWIQETLLFTDSSSQTCCHFSKGSSWECSRSVPDCKSS